MWSITVVEGGVRRSNAARLAAQRQQRRAAEGKSKAARGGLSLDHSPGLECMMPPSAKMVVAVR